MHNGIPEYYAKDLKSWRKWLKTNGEKIQGVWVLIYKKDSGIPSVSYVEAVEEALCFGWIDSVANKKEQNNYLQYFAKRNPKSNWSKINKDRVAKLIEEERMFASGLEMVALAKKNGTWTALDNVSALIIPDDLKQVLKKNKTAEKYFTAFPPSTKKGILEWIMNAKTPETRLKRITETITLAEKNIRANQYKPKT